MSSSAFTPSTTTVTNNVPVNVPVVTAWESYTPTGSWTSNTSYAGRWRRVGDSMEIQINVVLTGAPNATGLSVNIPTGYTIDTSKLTDTNLWKIMGKSGFKSAGTYYPGFVLYNDTSSVQVHCFRSPSNQNHDLSQITNLIPNTFANGDSVTINLKAPISQWSSGTTTLATRAVEEYASNSSTSTSGNSTAFAYGPSGSPIRSYTSGANVAHSYTVRFQSQILSTDSLILEVSQDRVVWVKIPHYAQSGGQTINEFGHTTTSYYGMGIRHDIGSTTDISVVFGGSGTNSNLDAWSAFTNYFWRVRKVSSGAQVGYPVSARNIVGDTSGSVVPVGMLGETTTIANATSTSVPSGTVNITGLTQTLQSGTWLLIAEGQVSVVSPASGMTSGQVAYMDIRIQNTTDSTTTAAISNVAYLRANSATTTNGGSGGFNLTSVVTLTSQKSFQVQGTYQSSITGGTTQTFQSGKFYAVRIA